MKRLPGIFLLAILVSCGSKDRIPSDILPPDKMETMLWDFIRADEFNQDYVFGRDTLANRKEISLEMYRKILAVHGVEQDEFRKSFYYYRAHPQLLRTVMDSVSKREEFILAPTVPKKIRDTISTGVTPVPL